MDGQGGAADGVSGFYGLMLEAAVRNVIREEIEKRFAAVRSAAIELHGVSVDYAVGEVLRDACEFLVERLEGDESQELRVALSALLDRLANR